MFARFTFSITVPKYGEERWIFSENNQCRNGKNFGVGDLYTFLYLYIHIFYIRNLWKNHRFRNINVDDFKRCDIDVVLQSNLHHNDIYRETIELHECLRITLFFTHFVWGVLTNFLFNVSEKLWKKSQLKQGAMYSKDFVKMVIYIYIYVYIIV